jgi:hypothetical protein
MQLRDPLRCRHPSPVDYGSDVEQAEDSPHRNHRRRPLKRTMS